MRPRLELAETDRSSPNRRPAYLRCRRSLARSLPWLAISCVLLAACGGASGRAASSAPTMMPSGAMAAPEAAPPMPAAAPAPAPAASSGAVAGNWMATPAVDSKASPDPDAPQAGSGATPRPRAGPLLVYEATLTLAVFQAKAGLDAVEKLARELGGYLLHRNDVSIAVRVPAAVFDQALEALAATGDELSRNVSARDVTEQFNDLSTRLKNAEAMRNRLSALLDKSQNVKDALAVEQQLERITLEIESIKGKLQRLRELIAYSTITVRYQPRPVDSVEPRVELPFPWLQQLGLTRLLELKR